VPPAGWSAAQLAIEYPDEVIEVIEVIDNRSAGPDGRQLP
jgi:hypothetical protein